MLKRITFLLLLWLATNLGAIAQTAFTDDFNAVTMSTNWWAGSTQYSLNQTGGVLKVGVNKFEGWKSFGVNLPVVTNLTSNPFVNIKIKADKDLNLDVYLTDGASVNKNIKKRISRSDGFTNVCWDFTGVAGLDLTTITRLLFAVNGTGLTYVGNLQFEDFKIGTDAQKLSNYSGFSDQKVYQNSKKNL